MHWLHVSIDLPSEQADAGARFWSDVLGWQLGSPWRGHPEFRSLTPPDGDGYVHVQTTGAGESTVHFDVGIDDVAATTEHLLAAGATQVADHGIWHVLKSPGGLAFCVVPSEGDAKPAASIWPDGHRTRLVQICIDCPPELLDVELRFWRDATRWEFRPSTGAEFAGKLYPPEPGPVHLLFQRLGDEDTGTHARAHIDLGTDDREAEARRLEELGATRLDTGDGWILLAAPDGMQFCATGNAPD